MKGARKVAARKPDVDWEKRLLAALTKAAGKGLARSRLLPTRKPEAEAALAGLLREGRLVRVGPSAKALYFLAEAAPTLRQAVEAVDRGAAERPARLFLEKELGRFCSRGEAFFLEEAVAELLARGVLLRLTRGRAAYYTHRAGIGPGKGPGEGPEFEPKRVLAAYRMLVDEQGFLDVRVAALASRSLTPLSALHPWLLAESRAGRAHLSRGDWSLASEEERKAAVSLDGEPYLLVRFESPS